MAKTTGDVIVEKLLDWGVDTVFGLPGDGINGIFESLRQNREKIRFIQVRHEEAAAFAACGYAKFTGRLGVCFATSGPGAIHLLNGLYDAKMDHAPVLAITGHTYHDQIGMHFQQEIDIIPLFKDVAEYNQMILGAEHAQGLVDVACRSALSSRSVSHLTCPADIQDLTVKDETASQQQVKGHTSTAWRPPIVVPQAETLKSAAALLNSGKKTVILAGAGALAATDELERLADTLAAPIIKPLLGKACVPDDSPYTTGGIGLLGTRPSEIAMEGCDTLLMVGTSFPYLKWYPKPGKVRAVQIDMDPTRLGLRYPIEIGMAGDSKATLQALLPMLRRREDRSFLEEAQEGMKEWWELMNTRGTREDTPVKPQVVAKHVNDRLAPDAIVTTDSGTITTWAARHILMRRGMMFSCSGNLATMAPGLPYAIGAQAAYPGRQVVAFVGDGGLTMLIGELATAVKHDLPIKVVVIKNNTLGQIKWEQMIFLGNPEYEVALQPIDFVKVAEACGAVGFRCERPNEVGPAIEAAFASRGPALVEATVDPFEPPFPASATPQQALKFAESLIRGEPDSGKIIYSVLKDKVKELI
ncbi:MAG TPA: thiamine pyrophosphate-dependent enzyme [Isosphaeraceae bacterium]|nr:thiamine pyrophosphate-dependent enzyme [Isosphaeraceae bacterium]